MVYRVMKFSEFIKKCVVEIFIYIEDKISGDCIYFIV